MRVRLLLIRLCRVERQEWIEQVEDVLRRGGHHRSSARPVVIRALANTPDPVTAQELERQIRQSGHIGRASIYQVLELLDRHGLVHRLDLGDGQARYLPADASDPERHYLLCRECGRLVALALDRVDQAISREASRLGVEVDPRPLVLHGVCAECRDAQAKSGPSTPPATSAARRTRGSS
ncbi:MAG: Fur family transcriptional regulator [Solirubrobacteraceae bacterium]